MEGEGQVPKRVFRHKRFITRLSRAEWGDRRTDLIEVLIRAC